MPIARRCQTGASDAVRWFAAPRKQSRVLRLQPLSHGLSQITGEIPHFLRLPVRDQTGSLVSPDVALFPKGIKTADESRRRADRESEGLNNAVMMLVPSGAVSLGRESRCGCLQRRVVRDTQCPVGAQILGGAIGEIALDDGEQVGDFLRARSVGKEPAVLRPIA